MAIEQPKYTVVRSDRPYEVRAYTDSVVAIVTVNGSRSDAVNAGFRLLAHYIFGQNQQKAKIAMTAPVTQTALSPGPTGLAAPTASSAATWIVRFTMPAQFSLQSLPAATDERIHFEQTRAHRAAVIRFSGFWSDANLKSHELMLLKWMQSQHLTGISAPTYAYYDPPWTPWFMRTIEVLVDLAPA